jgi:hypothetical protein
MTGVPRLGFTLVAFVTLFFEFGTLFALSFRFLSWKVPLRFAFWLG